MKDCSKFCLKVAGIQVLKSFYQEILLSTDFKITDILCTHIFNFKSFKSSQLCKLHLIYILTSMCCNHCNICIMTYLKAVVTMGQGHILTYTLKVHIFGCTKFGKFCEFNTRDSNNWYPWNFKGFLMTTKFNTSKISRAFWVVF